MSDGTRTHCVLCLEAEIRIIDPGSWCDVSLFQAMRTKHCRKHTHLHARTHTQRYSQQRTFMNFILICKLQPEAISPLPLHYFSNTEKMLKSFYLLAAEESLQHLVQSLDLFDSISLLEPNKANSANKEAWGSAHAIIKMHITKKLQRQPEQLPARINRIGSTRPFNYDTVPVHKHSPEISVSLLNEVCQTRLQ